MRTRGLISTLLLAGTVLATACPAQADDGGGAFVDNDGNPTAVAGDGEYGSDGSTGGGGDDDGCRWIVLIEDDFEWALYDLDGNRRFSDTGRWLSQDCPPGEPGSVGGVLVVPEGDEVDPVGLALDALARTSIAPPPVETSPSADRKLYAQVPTWLWVDPGWWQTHEATANAGRVWSTVRAIPVATTWSPGDGRSVSCQGPGTPWRPGLPEDASDCTHTYRTSSSARPLGTFDLQATVTFEVSWTSNATSGGTLPTISRTSTLEVEVGEIQAIGTRGGQ
jgi:hypothetical protein